MRFRLKYGQKILTDLDGDLPKVGSVIELADGCEYIVGSSIVVHENGVPQPFETVFCERSPAQKDRDAVAADARKSEELTEQIRQELKLAPPAPATTEEMTTADQIRKELRL